MDSCDNTGWGSAPGCFDLYERAGGQTTLISIGPQGGSGSYDVVAYLTHISPDAGRVYFWTQSRSYPRTTTAFRPGVRMCICAPAIRRCSCRPVRLAPTRPTSRISAANSGRVAVIFTSTDHFTPNDIDDGDDIYMRSGGTTSLVPDIGNSNRHTVFSHISDDGSRLLFLEYRRRSPVIRHKQRRPTSTWPPLQPATRAP